MSNNKFSSINSDTRRILARGIEASNNTWATGLNNNDLIIGPSGAGKTRGYVKPNILQCSESLIVADTKGSLMDQVGPALEQNGYKVRRIDLKDLSRCTIGYNPMDYVRISPDGQYSEQDILLMAEIIVPKACTDSRDPYWANSAKLYIASMLAYIMQSLPPEEHTLCTVPRLLEAAASGEYYTLMDEHCAAYPDSQAARLYRLFRDNRNAEKMNASTVGIAAERFAPFMSGCIEQLFTMPERIDFAELGRKKTALFLCISDTDRSMDRIVSFLYTQALHELCRSADEDYLGHCLPVPVRFILDDFATNAVVPNFQEMTSVIRSRGISVSIILQSMRQLSEIYGENNALTIANNCDHWIYLGGQDMYTASLIARRVDRREHSVLMMSPRQVYVLARGEEARLAQRYELSEHPLYAQTPEGAPNIARSRCVRHLAGYGAEPHERAEGCAEQEKEGA